MQQVAVPAEFKCNESLFCLPSRRDGILSRQQTEDVVMAVLQHLGPRIAGNNLTVGEQVVVGSTRQVFRVSVDNTSEAFVVKVALDGSLNTSPTLRDRPSMLWLPKYLRKHLSVEEILPSWEGRTVSIAPYVRGETLLTHAVIEGLSHKDYQIAFEQIPRLMRMLWEKVRDPSDSSRGLLFDHHLDNIVIGTKQPPFGGVCGGGDPKAVFIDERADGLYHGSETLEHAVADFKSIFRRHAFLRDAW